MIPFISLFRPFHGQHVTGPGEKIAMPWTHRDDTAHVPQDSLNCRLLTPILDAKLKERKTLKRQIQPMIHEYKRQALQLKQDIV